MPRVLTLNQESSGTSVCGNDGVLSGGNASAHYYCYDKLCSYNDAVNTSQQVMESLLFPRHCHEHSEVLKGVTRISSFTPPTPLEQKFISLQSKQPRPVERGWVTCLKLLNGWTLELGFKSRHSDSRIRAVSHLLTEAAGMQRRQGWGFWTAESVQLTDLRDWRASVFRDIHQTDFSNTDPQPADSGDLGRCVHLWSWPFLIGNWSNKALSKELGTEPPSFWHWSMSTPIGPHRRLPSQCDRVQKGRRFPALCCWGRSPSPFIQWFLQIPWDQYCASNFSFCMSQICYTFLPFNQRMFN